VPAQLSHCSASVCRTTDRRTDCQTDHSTVANTRLCIASYNTSIQATCMAYIFRLRQLETHTWSWVDCRNLMKDDTLLRSAIWHLILSSEPKRTSVSPLAAYIVERSAVWLLIFCVKCLASQFVIFLTRLSNYVLEYTLDRVLQASHRLLLLVIID